MPMSCSILGCPSRYSKGGNIKFFHFPFKDACQLTAWLNAIKRQDWTPSKYDRICNEHFTTNDYLHRPDAHYTHLKPTAVPSIFPSSIKSNRKNQCKIMKIDNENEKDEIDAIEKNSKIHENCLTNIHIKINSTIEQDIYDSRVNIQSEGENIENVHTIVDVTEESNVNSDINVETYDPGTVETEDPCMISSSIYESMNIEENQINDYDNLDCSKLHRIKKSPTLTEINLRHKIRILQQKLRRRDAKIIYLQRVLTNLKQKQYILSAIQRL
ncbi:THAP domain-containing protein 1 B-like [Camponotus floridanus]|uniref:THAP domain-containing protein 1 B-like n=1 Tax=Camponotus floridanus TaxID=104421 RepID=UPI000DC698D7|nr:THAP domain-containing protein 1 B-like [Camponotus floridanus]